MTTRESPRRSTRKQPSPTSSLKNKAPRAARATAREKQQADAAAPLAHMEKEKKRKKGEGDWTPEDEKQDRPQKIGKPGTSAAPGKGRGKSGISTGRGSGHPVPDSAPGKKHGSVDSVLVTDSGDDETDGEEEKQPSKRATKKKGTFKVKAGSIAVVQNTGTLQFDENQHTVSNDPVKYRNNHASDLVAKVAKYQGSIGSGATILVWGTFQDCQTNIWVPQTVKDPKLKVEFEVFQTATVTLCEKLRQLQEAPGYQPWNESKTTTIILDPVVLQQKMKTMSKEERKQYIDMMEQLKREEQEAAMSTSSPTGESTKQVLSSAPAEQAEAENQEASF